MGQEHRPWDLALGMREIACFTSSGMTKSKANEVIGVLIHSRNPDNYAMLEVAYLPNLGLLKKNVR